jgi:Protein of unknown function (DUF3572)
MSTVFFMSFPAGAPALHAALDPSDDRLSRDLLMNPKPHLRTRTVAMDRARAEALAFEALGFLARSPERLVRFLDTTGMGPETLRAAAQSPGFLPGLMDYVCHDEELLLALAEEAGVKPEILMQARRLLAPTELPE